MAVDWAELEATAIVVVGESSADTPSLAARVVEVEASPVVEGAADVGPASVVGASDAGAVVRAVPAAALDVGYVVRAVLTGYEFLVAGVVVPVAAGRVVVVALVGGAGWLWGAVVVARFLVVAVD